MGQTVTSVTREDDHFVVATTTDQGEQRWAARTVVIATGAYDLPNRMDIPGEDLPHVSHYYTEAHASTARTWSWSAAPTRRLMPPSRCTAPASR